MSNIFWHDLANIFKKEKNTRQPPRILKESWAVAAKGGYEATWTEN